jgi:hypothetical protein
MPAMAGAEDTQPMQAERGVSDHGGPLFELDGDRVRVSLTSLGVAAVVFAGLLLFSAAFALGRKAGDAPGYRRGYADGRASYQAEAVSEIEAARSEPPATHLLGDLVQEPAQNEMTEHGRSEAPIVGGPPVARTSAASTDPESRAPRWIRDYTYIVVQEFLPGREGDARRTQAYLAQYGVETELTRYASGAIQLITAQGYNRKDPTQRGLADELLERVQSLGAEYFASGGGYRLEGYFKTLKGDSW